jgi:hypothetical protein
VDKDDVRRSDALKGIVSESEGISCCKSDGTEKYFYSGTVESKFKIQRSAGSENEIETVDCGNKSATGKSSNSALNSDRFGALSLKMMDCDGVSVKLEFNDKNQHDSILSKIIEIYSKTKSYIVQIFFKTICVKSSFANQITCLLATGLTKYVILQYPNVNPHEVRKFGSTSYVAVLFLSPCPCPCPSVSTPQWQRWSCHPHLDESI